MPFPRQREVIKVSLMDPIITDILITYGHDLDQLFYYLSELLGGQAAQSVITEDIYTL